MSKKLVVAISPGVANELPMTCTNGIRQISANPHRTMTLTTLKIRSPRLIGRAFGFFGAGRAVGRGFCAASSGSRSVEGLVIDGSLLGPGVEHTALRQRSK